MLQQIEFITEQQHCDLDLNVNEEAAGTVREAGEIALHSDAPDLYLRNPRCFADRSPCLRQGNARGVPGCLQGNVRNDRMKTVTVMEFRDWLLEQIAFITEQQRFDLGCDAADEAAGTVREAGEMALLLGRPDLYEATHNICADDLSEKRQATAGAVLGCL